MTWETGDPTSLPDRKCCVGWPGVAEVCEETSGPRRGEGAARFFPTSGSLVREVRLWCGAVRDGDIYGDFKGPVLI